MILLELDIGPFLLVVVVRRGPLLLWRRLIRRWSVIRDVRKRVRNRIRAAKVA